MSVKKLFSRRRPLSGCLLIVLTGIGLLTVMWLALELVFGKEAARSRELQSRLARLELGMTQTEVRRQMGPPAWNCPGEIEFPHSASFRLQARSEEIRSSLSRVTASRWLYLMRDDQDQPRCETWYLDVELGFDSKGHMIWLVRVSGESRLEILEGVLNL